MTRDAEEPMLSDDERALLALWSTEGPFAYPIDQPTEGTWGWAFRSLRSARNYDTRERAVTALEGHIMFLAECARIERERQFNAAPPTDIKLGDAADPRRG